MSTHQSELFQSTAEYPLSTKINQSPIHLLLKNGKAACGRTHVSRAWSYVCWPTPDSTWQKDICSLCLTATHTPAVRPERQVA
jgi:hypothetical protein